MVKTIKKVIASTLSILGISSLIWVLFLFNPSWSYANKTEFDVVTVYHNQDLDEQTEFVINNAVAIIKKSPLFDDKFKIDLCFNDDRVYPNLNPQLGQPLAYAIFNKTILKNCEVKFDEHVAETKWAINNYEHRKFNLTWLLAHEFSHNLQNHADFPYVIKSTLGIHLNWKLEGHAEYIAREFRNDGALKNKIKKYLLEEEKEQSGLPVFELEDGTQQIFSYFKYALVIQYLMDEKEMDFGQVCKLETGLDDLYAEMIDWSNK